MYNYVAASIFYPEFGGLSIWVKHRKYRNEFKVIQNTQSNMLIEAPDRDILITRDGHSSLSSKMHGWDSVVNISPFHKSFEDLGVKWIMVNCPQNLAHTKTNHHNLPIGTNVLADSGGFQVLTGRVKYLDPKTVALWYKNNTHYGITLDLPCRFPKEDLILKSAYAQKQNTDIMKQYIDPKRLFNVFHGIDKGIKYFDMFRDIVEDNDIERICIPALYYGNIISGLSKFLYAINTGRRYKHYHLLGVFNMAFTLPLLKLLSLPNMPYVTFDSTSHFQEVRSRKYFIQKSIDRCIERNIIGLKSLSSRVPSQFKLLPCNCPICSSLKYTDILGGTEGPMILNILAMHNLFNLNGYLNQMSELAKGSSFSEYRKIIGLHMGGRGGTFSREVETAIGFIECYANNGLKIANQKYSHYINQDFLFSGEYQLDEEKDELKLGEKEYEALLDTYLGSKTLDKKLKKKSKVTLKGKKLVKRFAGKSFVGTKVKKKRGENVKIKK